MNILKDHLFPICLATAFSVAMIISFWPQHSSPSTHFLSAYQENEDWQPPDETTIPFTPEGDQIRYGKELVTHTGFYFGPSGTIAAITNGMSCQNCHLNAGTLNFANPFSEVAAIYPRFRERSGHLESVERRVNDCFQRSLNGLALDSTSKEMQAIVAYVKWVGNNVPKGVIPKGVATEKLPFLARAADTITGKIIYINKCQRCHGINGEGVWATKEKEYTYPPLWGNQSFNVGAGMLRLSLMAGFIRNNMPLGSTQKTPELSIVESWDVAAFIVSQKRGEKKFNSDWPVIEMKPVDYPFGPFKDSFSEVQHKYGPFGPIKSKKGT